MHHFAIEPTPPNEWGARFALLRIDGIPLLDIIRELEAPLAAAEGHPDLAGAYHYLNLRNVVPPSRHLLGQAVSPTWNTIRGFQSWSASAVATAAGRC